MDISNDILIEDWEGLKSETERVLIVYGYPNSDDISDHAPNVKNSRDGKEAPGTFIRDANYS